jgi:sugar O-acyltransferase (sialic acid O-acetyltransferase NeuD family)
MKRTREDIILIGGGGHCSSVIDVIEEQGFYNIRGIIDLREKLGGINLGYSIIGDDNDLKDLVKIYRNFLVTIGHLRSPERRIEIYDMLRKASAILPVIISPRAYVSRHTSIGPGSVIMHMAQINAGTVIGENCIINSKALIEHGVQIGNHCHISTGAIINGDCQIGKRCFIGSGAICRESITIPDGSFIKAGTLVK